MRDTIAESAALLFALDDGVVDLQAEGDQRRTFSADEPVPSTVLLDFRAEAREFFE